MAGTIVANTINTDTGVFLTNNAFNGIAKVWANWDGATSPYTGIRSSFNVSSITYNSTGDYTINFTVAMPNANYSTVGVCAFSNSIVAGNTMRGFTPQSYATTSIRYVVTDGVSGLNPLYCNILVISS
jgi:hypothetical protein